MCVIRGPSGVEMNKKTITYTKSQSKALQKLVGFLHSHKRILILNGYAGTGKTTLVKDFVAEFKKRNLPFVLLASTGRAAKILNRFSGQKAVTIHSQIYKFDDLNENIGTVATLVENEDKEGTWLFPEFKVCHTDSNTTFIIDEASMISDEEDKEPEIAFFGSGKVLSDLISFAPRAKFIFVGDECQLPPVKGAFSPALNQEYLMEHFRLPSDKCTLTEIVRHASTSDVLTASQEIRKLISHSNDKKWNQFPLKNYQNIHIVPSEDIWINSYIEDIKAHGYEHATCICRSNKTASRINSLIRQKLGRGPETLKKNDLLLITQNNLLSGLMNGDFVRIISVGERVQHANLTFRKVEVEEIGTRKRVSQYLIEELLYQNLPRLTKAQQRTLYIDYYKRMKAKGIYQTSKEFKDGLFKDDYLNALHAAFGYAITCHKAQGGEWSNVYLNIPQKLAYHTTEEGYRWLYTALTRAKENIFLINGFWLR